MRGKIKEEKFFGVWRVMEKKRVKIRVLEDENKKLGGHTTLLSNTHTHSH